MAAASSLIRQWTLLRRLSRPNEGLTVKQMAAELGVSLKTIRRDLETFRRVGFPLQETVGQFGRKRWSIDMAQPAAGLCFAFDEALALYVARRLMEPLAGTPFWDAAQRAFRKVRATLGAEAIKYVDRFGRLFHQTMIGLSDYSQKTELIDCLLIAIEDCRTARLTYRSLRSSEPVTYEIHPYGLIHHRGSLYLVGRFAEHEEIRHWKIDRMDRAELTDSHFTRPADFDLAAHMARSFGVFHEAGAVHVRVRFSAEVARYVGEKLWHPSQQFRFQPDGRLVAEFDLDGTEEIKRWILSFGRHAEVLAPEELRREIRVEVDAVLAAYADKHPVEP